MQIAQSHKPFNRVDYYPLGNGYVDVFLHRNEMQETDIEGNINYKVEEAYFQIEDTVTKEIIEENFDFMWSDVEKEPTQEPTLEERLQALEVMELERILGGM